MFRINRFLMVLAVALAFAVPVFSQTLYGISNGRGTAEDNQVYQIDPTTGTTSSALQVTLSGFTVLRSLALTAQPGTGTLFALIETEVDSNTNRRLVTIDPVTGIATNIGQTGNSFSTLGFRANGTLYGVTGDGAGSNPETLFTISVANASTVLQFALGNGADGETIAFHGNGLMYHSSGNTTAFFESVNVDTQVVTPIGTAGGEMFGMGFNAGNGLLYGSDIGNNLFTIDIATGARAVLGSIDSVGSNRGLAFVAAVPEPATMALVGTALFGIGYVRYRQYRRNKALNNAKIR